MPKSHHFDVVWSDIAAGDLEAAIEFIEQQNPQAAVQIWNHLRKRAETLSYMPLRGRVVPELKAIGLDTYRELIIDPYRLLFRVEGRTVFVFGIFDGRRDMEEILFERLTRL